MTALHKWTELEYLGDRTEILEVEVGEAENRDDCYFGLSSWVNSGTFTEMGD